MVKSGPMGSMAPWDSNGAPWSPWGPMHSECAKGGFQRHSPSDFSVKWQGHIEVALFSHSVFLALWLCLLSRCRLRLNHEARVWDCDRESCIVAMTG